MFHELESGNVLLVYLKDQFSLLATYLLACILVAYWLFISNYKAHINVLWTFSRSSQVTIIYIALFMVQIVSKQLYSITAL